MYHEAVNQSMNHGRPGIIFVVTVCLGVVFMQQCNHYVIFHCRPMNMATLRVTKRKYALDDVGRAREVCSRVTVILCSWEAALNFGESAWTSRHAVSLLSPDYL